jgi:hypothetical protein
MASVSPRELKYLMTFHAREGFTVERTELAVAMLTSFQINKVSKKKVKPKDVMAYADPWREIKNKIGPNPDDDNSVRDAFIGSGMRVIRVDRVTRQPI